jgi:hypothetical protein
MINSMEQGGGPPGGTAVRRMAQLMRILFEVEREMVRTATTLIYRCGDPELKYLLCQHIWESAGHARFLLERGRELAGFGSGESVRGSIRRIFEEAVRGESEKAALAGFYRVLKPALRDAYAAYLDQTHAVADWPSRRLVEAFTEDEDRHAKEIRPHLKAGEEIWTQHLQAAMAVYGGDWFSHLDAAEGADGLRWRSDHDVYSHPPTCNRGPYPICSSVFSEDPAETPIVRHWLEDPATDARVIRVMIYVWLMMELDAVDYLATVFYDTPEAPFDLHFDLARHLWDESRHSQFGFRQLPKLGIDLMTVEHSLDLYNILVQMTPAERYAMMTMEFESGSFPTKARIMQRIRELNDFEADTLLAFDRNDEQNHVRYGHRWLPEIMKLFDENRPVGEFVEATRKRFEELSTVYGGRVEHSLAPENRLTGNRILAHLSH